MSVFDKLSWKIHTGPSHCVVSAYCNLYNYCKNGQKIEALYGRLCHLSNSKIYAPFVGSTFTSKFGVSWLIMPKTYPYELQFAAII